MTRATAENPAPLSKSLVIAALLGASGVGEIVRNGTFVATLTARDADVLFIALAFPTAIALVFSSAIRVAAVPALATASSPERLYKRSLAMLSGGAVLLCAAGILAAPQLAGLLAPGFDATERKALESMLRPLLLLVAIQPASSLAAAALNVHGSHALPSAERGIRAVLVVAALPLLAKEDLSLLIPLLVLLAAGLQTSWFIVAVMRRPVMVAAAPMQVGNGSGSLIRTTLTLAGGYLVAQAVPLIDRALLSSETGSATIVSFIPPLVISTSALFSTGIQTLLLPRVARLDGPHAAEEVSRATWAAVALVLPPLALVATNAPLLLAALAGSGLLAALDPSVSADVLLIYLLTVPFTLVGQISSVYFYAHNRAGVPTRQVIMNALLNGVLSVALTPILGVYGAALSAGVTFVCNGVVMRSRLISAERVQSRVLNWARARATVLIFLAASAMPLAIQAGVAHELRASWQAALSILGSATFVVAACRVCKFEPYSELLSPRNLVRKLFGERIAEL